MAYRQLNGKSKKEKVSKGDVKRRERRIADLEKDLKLERQKYEERLMHFSKENEQLKVLIKNYRCSFYEILIFKQ